jgi:hypothetical protein
LEDFQPVDMLDLDALAPLDSGDSSGPTRGSGQGRLLHAPTAVAELNQKRFGFLTGVHAYFPGKDKGERRNVWGLPG